MYDQVVPAVQDMLKRIPDRSESEGERMQGPNIFNPAAKGLHRILIVFVHEMIRMWNCVLFLSVRGGVGGDLPLRW